MKNKVILNEIASANEKDNVSCAVIETSVNNYRYFIKIKALSTKRCSLLDEIGGIKVSISRTQPKSKFLMQSANFF